MMDRYLLVPALCAQLEHTLGKPFWFFPEEDCSSIIVAKSSIVEQYNASSNTYLPFKFKGYKLKINNI